MTLPTPRPWKVVKLHTDHHVIDFEGRASDQLMITDTWSDKPYVQEANAYFIVKACNLFDELVDAIESLSNGLEWRISENQADESDHEKYNEILLLLEKVRTS